jgi:hypothetical protein
MSEQAPSYFIWKSIATSPFRILGAIVLVLLHSTLLGLSSVALGHLCLSSDDSYLEDPTKWFDMRQAIYLGDVGGLICSPFVALWLACLVNTYERFLAQNADAKSNWMRSVFTGVYRSDQQKAVDLESRTKHYEEAVFWNDASWLVLVPLSLFNLFFSIPLGGMIGALGSAATHIGYPRHVGLSGVVGAVCSSAGILFFVRFKTRSLNVADVRPGHYLGLHLTSSRGRLATRCKIRGQN